MKRSIALFFGVVLVGSMFFGSMGFAAQNVTITFWHTYNTQNYEAKTLREVIIPEFQKRNPGIKVKDLVVPYDDMKRKLLAGAAAETLPELVRMDIIWVPQFANAGLLEPVSKTYAKDFSKMKDNFFPGPLSTVFWKGNYYGLPLDTNTRVLFYNKT